MISSKNSKPLLVSFLLVLVVISTLFTFVACKKEETPLYKINFAGNVEGEKYNVAGTTWTKSEQEGYDAVYTLTGNVKRDTATAQAMGYTDGREHFALIRFTSDTIERVSYDSEAKTGFFCEITNFFGTDNQAEPVLKHGGFGSGNETTKNTTYFLYQGIDNQIRTMRVKISFDGSEQNARVYKFVIDPKNYTLEASS